MVGVSLFLVAGDWVSLSLCVKGLLNLANLYILLLQFVMEAVRNVWILFCIGTTDQPKTSSHAAIVLGWRRYFFQVDEPVYIYRSKKTAAYLLWQICRHNEHELIDRYVPDRYHRQRMVQWCTVLVKLLRNYTTYFSFIFLLHIVIQTYCTAFQDLWLKEL